MPSCCYALPKRNLLILSYSRSEDVNLPTQRRWKKILTASKNVVPKVKRYSRKRPKPGDCDITAAPDAATKLKVPKLATDGEHALVS